VDRQTVALKQLSVLLYVIGLSYEGVRALLGDLRCPISTATIRKNVLKEGGRARLEGRLGRLRLAPRGEGRLAGPDGAVEFRLVGSPSSERWLEVEIAEEPGALDLGYRVEASARLLRLNEPTREFPPATA
jgi:hypothetical protein